MPRRVVHTSYISIFAFCLLVLFTKCGSAIERQTGNPSPQQKKIQTEQDELICGYFDIDCHQDLYSDFKLEEWIQAQEYLSKLIYKDRDDMRYIMLAIDEFIHRNPNTNSKEVTKAGFEIRHWIKELDLDKATLADSLQGKLLKEREHGLGFAKSLPIPPQAEWVFDLLVSGISRHNKQKLDALAKTPDLEKQFELSQFELNLPLKYMWKSKDEIMVEIFHNLIGSPFDPDDPSGLPIGIKALDNIFKSDEYMGCRVFGAPGSCVKGDFANFVEVKNRKTVLDSVQQDLAQYGKISKGTHKKLIELFSSLEQTMGHHHKEVLDLLEAQNKNLTKMKQGIDENTKAIKAYTNDIKVFTLELLEKQAIQQQQAQAERLLAQLKREAIQSSIYLVSALVSAEDPKLGNAMYVLSKASYDVVSSAIEYANTIAFISEAKEKGQAMAEVATNMTAIIMTANVVSASMQIASLLLDTGPSPEQLIMQQIQVLQMQIADLGRVMNSRFDRVDRMLNLLYKELTNDLAFIQEQNRITHEELEEIQKTLRKVQTKLTRMELDISEQLGDLHRQPFLEASRSYLSWGEIYTYPTDAMTFEEYKEAERLFYVHATVYSKSSVLAGPKESLRGFSDSDAKEEMEKYPISKNINYLNEFPKKNLKETGKLWQGRLPNPTDWLAGALAYSQLAEEHPEHADNISPQRYQEIIEIGKSLLTAFERMAERKRFLGSEDDPNYVGLISKYKDNLNALKREIIEERTEFLKIQQDRGYTLDRINLWKGPVQMTGKLKKALKKDFNRSSQGTMLDGCKDDGGAFTGTVEMVNSIYRREDLWPFFIAHYTGIGKLKICGERSIGRIINMREGWAARGIEGDKGSIDKRGNRLVQYDFTIKVSYENRLIATQRYTALCANKCNPLQESKEGSFRKASGFDASYGDVYEKVAKFLSGKLVEYYSNIEDKLEVDSNEIANAAKRLSGIKTMIRAYAIFGLQQFLNGSDEIRYAIFGDGLLDQDSIARLYRNTVEIIPRFAAREDDAGGVALSKHEKMPADALLDPRHHDVVEDILSPERIDHFSDYLKAAYDSVENSPHVGESIRHALWRLEGVKPSRQPEE